MKEINQRELLNRLAFFNNKNVKITYSGIISANVNISNVNIKLNVSTGFIDIKDLIHNNKFRINTTFIYNIKLGKDNKELLLQLDNNVNISLKIKN